jgi:hypothetical protein
MVSGLECDDSWTPPQLSRSDSGLVSRVEVLCVVFIRRLSFEVPRVVCGVHTSIIV